ncbi:DUF2474 domain-containing protein [Massilia sp. IC2-278]|uniref:DUF2474 domain-containing protein n=1 Tax=Massilia sp. IC2-278 TaxID=2887200 RepID=UPI001E3B4F34|nr:DUF2474 domain-containing protein [Massilia sp. IC2-278]MCC2960500.1 DUF2474 domain-containing protein [Massilia sp. IC2-278]
MRGLPFLRFLHARPAPLWLRRLGWMLALWAGGVAALFLVASLIRAIMHAAGMR